MLSFLGAVLLAARTYTGYDWTMNFSTQQASLSFNHREVGLPRVPMRAGLQVKHISSFSSVTFTIVQLAKASQLPSSGQHTGGGRPRAGLQEQCKS